MSRFFYTALLGIGFALSTAAYAASEPTATLTNIDGKVMVNQGDEFKPAVEGMRLKPGDRVMLEGDAKADIKFDDECQYAAKKNSIITIPDKSTCAGGEPLVQDLAPKGGEAIGATGAGNEGVWWMVGIVTAIDIWWLNEDDSDIISP